MDDQTLIDEIVYGQRMILEADQLLRALDDRPAIDPAPFDWEQECPWLR